MSFPDCHILTMPQRSPEWAEARRGILTASNFGPWLLKDTDQRSKDAREKALCALIAERANCESAPVFESWAMKRGTELEPQAIASFEGETGFKVRQVGFCRSKKGLFGCSPDGLIGDDCGIENKCPVPETHIRYRRSGDVPYEHLFQVHGCLAVTGAKSWWYQSFAPGLAPLRLIVHRDDFTERLLEALIVFSGQFERAWLDECAAVAESKGKRRAA